MQQRGITTSVAAVAAFGAAAAAVATTSTTSTATGAADDATPTYQEFKVQTFVDLDRQYIVNGDECVRLGLGHAPPQCNGGSTNLTFPGADRTGVRALYGS